MLNKKIIFTIVLFLILGSGGYYFYQDFVSNKSFDSKNETRNSNDKDKDLKNISIGATGDYTVKILPSNDAPTIPIPDLDKKIIFDNSLSLGEKNDATKRINSLVKILKNDNHSFSAWMDLAIQKKRVGDYQGAKEIWEFVNIMSPKNSISFFNLGDLNHYYLKNFPESEKSFLGAIKNDPHQVIAYKALYDLYTLSYTEKKDLAEGILLRGLKNNPNNVDLLVSLAIYYKGSDNKAQAVTYYEKAIKEAKKLKNTSLAELLQKELNKII